MARDFTTIKVPVDKREYDEIVRRAKQAGMTIAGYLRWVGRGNVVPYPYRNQVEDENADR